MKTLLLFLAAILTLPVYGAEFPVKVNKGQTFEARDQYESQREEEIAVECWGGKIRLTNFGVSQGGIIRSHGADEIKLTNVYNTGRPNGNTKEPGCYNALIWDTPAKLFTWDNSGLPAWLKAHGKPAEYAKIREGEGEAAFRIKVRRAEITGCWFVGLGGKRKPAVQVRHVEQSVTFKDCKFDNTWVEIGRQKIQMGPIAIWDPTQSVKLTTFQNCTFTIWTPAKKVVDRKPGVDRIVYKSCVDPSGKVFSRED